MEFIGMVDLSFYLHGSLENASSLDWGRRLKIAAGVARGIKASNVLNDVKFCAKICDYGLLLLAPNEKKGLLGHIDDEYWTGHKRVASKENDVYGFGVVLLEILSGRISNEQGSLVRWVIPLINEMKIGDFLDARLVIPKDLQPLVRLAKVALACVANSRQHRPSIVPVASILNDLKLS